MKRLVQALAVACSCATMLYAQTPGSDAKPKGDAVTPRPMTMTGCVRKDDNETARYVLAHAVRVDRATKTAEEEAETIPTAYELIAGKKINLEKHVGHMVEVTGTRAAARTGTISSTAATAGPSQGGQITPQLRVLSVKRVVGDCE